MQTQKFEWNGIFHSEGARVVSSMFPFPLYSGPYSLYVHQPVPFSQNWIFLSI